MTIGSTRLFPLLVAFVLAVLTFLLERAVREPPAGPEPRRHDPDYIVERFVLTSYGADGAVEGRVSAAKMTHFPDDGSTEVIAPRLSISKPGRPRYQGSAARATVADDGEEIFLYQDVVLIREADATRPEGRAETEFLHVVGGSALARTDRRVRLRDGDRTLIGRGMEYHHESGRFVLRHDVRGTFEGPGPRR